MPSPIFIAYCRIMATSSSTANSSPVSATTRAVPRALSGTTLYGRWYLEMYSWKDATEVSRPRRSLRRVNTRSG
jgi:hypothetical protein